MQHAFGLAWSASQSRSPFMRAVPTLEAIALRKGGIPNVLLAAGAGSAAILSEHGHQLDTIRFPVRPCTFSFLSVPCPGVACPMLCWLPERALLHVCPSVATN